MYANAGYEAAQLPSHPLSRANPPSRVTEYDRSDQSSLSIHTNRRQADTIDYERTEQQLGQIPQLQQHNEPEQYHHLDSLDQDMLAEAQEDGVNSTGPESHEKEDAELEKSLAWIPKSDGLPVARNKAPLPIPVVIPQAAPGIKSPFARAWSPILLDHGVNEHDFLQFVDHLNVCKTASPPLQLLNLAGTVVGFTPVPFAFAISAGTSAIATGGMMAVARIRITRYLERVNKEYFIPRGLQARIAKQNSLPQILGQPPNAPLLAPLPLNSDQARFPSIRDRRMQALGRYIAPIQYQGYADVSEERNLLDKLSAKMTARTATRAENKMNKHHVKDIKDARKDEAKIEEKMAKARAKGKTSKLAKLETERAAIYRGGVGSGSTAKEEKAAGKFMFVVVHNVQHIVA